MEELPASGYCVDPDNCSNGGSEASPRDADSADPCEKNGANGSKNGAQRRSKGARRPVAVKQKAYGSKIVSRTEEHAPEPRAGSLERTKRLLLAALRVWELKRGIRGSGG